MTDGNSSPNSDGNIQTDETVTLNLKRPSLTAEPDLLLWFLIRNNMKALSFESYKAYTDLVLCGDAEAATRLELTESDRLEDARGYVAHFQSLATGLYTDLDAYRILKAATEAFVTVFCSVKLELQGDTLKLLATSSSAKVADSTPTSGATQPQTPIRISSLDFGNLLKNVDAQRLTTEALIDWWNKDYLKTVTGAPAPTLPYLQLVADKLKDVPIISHLFSGEADRSCYGILADKLTKPVFIELIWSYWHEEGMLVQTMNAISRRFQNVRGLADHDPLATITTDPLRPLNNLLWGYIQDEQSRLTVVRRAYEYNHQYGLTLEGKAVPQLRPADSRSRFLEAFHNLLRLATIFYKQDDDLMVRADGFPVLNALKDLHMLLAEGAHNQFGDLPTRARIEMLMQQWLLARPEFREFLPTRLMIAYPEPWMDRVDAMKKLQGWGEVSIMQFRELAIYGEQILLSVRFGNWGDVVSADQAAIWARFWRSEIQRYIHAYRAVTGVDLSADSTWQQRRELVTAQPSALLRQRLLNGHRPALPAREVAISMPSYREQRAARKRVPSN